jgi:CDP-glucose 4,6-dehydratase
MRWHTTDQPQPHESNLLYLDSSKARNKLGWQPVWNIDTTLQKTTEWYRAWLVNQEVISRQQLGAYIDAAVHAKNEWAEL